MILSIVWEWWLNYINYPPALFWGETRLQKPVTDSRLAPTGCQDISTFAILRDTMVLWSLGRSCHVCFFLHPLILSGYGGWEDPTSEKKILSLLAARKKSSMLLVAPALYAAPTLWIFSELRKPWDLDFLGLLSSALQGSCQDILCH